jgi:hypothetical protein
MINHRDVSGLMVVWIAEWEEEMRSCENCGAELEPDDVNCPACIAALELQLHVDEARPKWSEKIDEYVCFHWLAQCQRRLMFPVDETEEIPYVAFDRARRRSSDRGATHAGRRKHGDDEVTVFAIMAAVLGRELQERGVFSIGRAASEVVTVHPAAIERYLADIRRLADVAAEARNSTSANSSQRCASWS